MEEKRFTLRMNGLLFEEISQYAEINRRSVAKEIEFAIAKYLHDLKHKEILDKYKDEKNISDMAEEAMKKIFENDKKYGIN